MNWPDNPTHPGGKTAQRITLHRGSRFDYEQVRYAGASGSQVVREVIRHPGSVVVLPILGDPSADSASVVLIRNHRVASGTDLLELPAGTLGPGEPPEAAAARETAEESGFRPGTMTCLGSFHPSPGLSDERMWAFVARDLVPQRQELEDDESITVHPTPVGALWAMLDRGEIIDAKTMLVVLWASRRGLLPPAP
ncbi:MAG: NUDIX hydrolase [Phycisphaeraceae bacterium]|nr:NUDIX hydrolase [Phycisphaerae bacterium]MBX3391213.1 NUDIX hydrolase [Phycisphaeraceae bacterium]HRJ50073.1 NUDIX hydrolase [Phycisphaerales bacterium]